jgi:hypothetical protein
MRTITTYNVFDGAQTVVKNTAETSSAIDLRSSAENGYFSLEYLITGDGTLTLSYIMCSTEKGTYFTPTGASAIATGLTKTSGASGLGGLTFYPEEFPFIKIVATETVNSANAIVTLKLNVW